MKVSSSIYLFIPFLLAVEGSVDSNTKKEQVIDTISTPPPPISNDYEIYGRIEDVLQANKKSSTQCKATGSRCNRWNNCCSGNKCLVAVCKKEGVIGDTCRRSHDCSKGLKCRKLKGGNKACIPDVAGCLFEARKEMSEKVTDNMQNRFLRALKRVAPDNPKEGWKELSNLNIKNVAKIMCNAMDAYQSATEKSMSAFEKCTKDYDDDVRKMIMYSAILRFGVESDVNFLGLSGSAGAGTLLDPKTDQLGCYAQICAGSMISLGGGDGVVPVVGMEFVDSIDNIPTTSYEGSLKVPFMKKYANAYSFTSESLSSGKRYMTGTEIKPGSKNKLGGSAYICNTFSMKYDKDDNSISDGDDDEGDDDEGDNGDNGEGDNDLDDNGYDGYFDDDVTTISI